MLRINRREFVANTAASAAGIILGSGLMGFASKEKSDIPSGESKKESLMQEVMKYRKIDTHAHVYFSEDSPRTQIDFADRLGIEKLMISRPMVPFSKGLPEEFRKCNDLVLRCVKQHPDRFIGMLVVNPTYGKESLEEIKRCVDAGMVGTGELYNHVKINDPSFYPIIEKFIDLKMIILMHTAIGYARVKLNPHDYYMSFVPVGWHWEIVILLNILTFLVVSLVLLLPTMVIAGINPIKAIRFD